MKNTLIFKTIIFIGFIVSFFVKDGFTLETTRGIIHFALAIVYMIYYFFELKAYKNNSKKGID